MQLKTVASFEIQVFISYITGHLCLCLLRLCEISMRTFNINNRPLFQARLFFFANTWITRTQVILVFFFFLLTENVVTAPLWFIFLVLHKEGRSFHIWLLCGHDPHDSRCGSHLLIKPQSTICQGFNQFQIFHHPIRCLALMKANMM